MQLAAIDLGASKGRVIVGSYDGGRIELREIYTFPNCGHMVNGHFYWDILHLLYEIKIGLAKAFSYTDGQLTSIGIDTWGVDYGLLDKKGQLLANPYHYRDKRTNGLLTEIFSKISRQEIYHQTGTQLLQFNTLVQLYADLKYRPWIIDNAKSLLFIPDLLTYFLTGYSVNEYTISSTSQLLNPFTGKWATDIFSKLEIPRHLMGELTSPGTIIGSTKDEHIPVVAVGSHDTASAVAAAPLADKHSAYISSGTWSLLGVELTSPLVNKASLENNFTNEGGVGGTIRFLKNICGLWLIQQCKQSWQRQGKDFSYQELAEAAAKEPANLFRVDPDDPLFLNPADMPATIVEYCRQTNQQIPINEGQLVRGIYESLAFTYAEKIKQLEEIINRDIKYINMVGGGIQAEMLCQLTANATDRPVVTGPVEATALGNILVQLIAQKEIASLNEGRNLIRQSVAIKEYLPQI